jgi:hypothetical protein
MQLLLLLTLLLLLLLYKLPHFVFCLEVFCCFLLNTRANFVTCFWHVKFARNKRIIELLLLLLLLLSRKTNVLIYDYKLCQSSIARTDSIKDLGVFIDAKLHFHDYVNYTGCFTTLGHNCRR